MRVGRVFSIGFVARETDLGGGGRVRKGIYKWVVGGGGSSSTYIHRILHGAAIII
jgi:hypothetical protein